MTLTVGSLFSGIGGLDLGLERAGMNVIWHSEVDPYACRVLARHWPTVPNLGDITAIDWSTVVRPDVICGGYPCQPFSLAGVRRGAADPRHLWPHFRDAIRHLRPRYALLENVPGHLSLGFGRVLGDLAECGYDAEWDCIPAAAVGAPHLRYRIFVVAHAVCDVVRLEPVAVDRSGGEAVPRDDGAARHLADADGIGRQPGRHNARQPQVTEPVDRRSPAGVADPEELAVGPGLRPGIERGIGRGRPRDRSGARDVAHTEGERRPAPGQGSTRQAWADHVARHAGQLPGARAWAVEPDVGRVAHGVPNRVDRLRTLGNAVVPQVAEWIGHRIIQAAA